MRHIPIFTFINKMDRDANDTFDLLDEIEKEVIVPDGDEEKFLTSIGHNIQEFIS